MTALHASRPDTSHFAELERTLGRVDLTATMSSPLSARSAVPAWAMPVAICAVSTVILVLTAVIVIH